MINPESFHRDVRKTLKPFLKKYFDGGNHTFGAKSIVFPEVDIHFRRPQLGAALTKPLIAIDEYDILKQTRKATKTGMISYEDHPMRFLIFTASTNLNWADHDNVANLLHMLFFSAASELGAAGMRVVRVGNTLPIPLDASQEYHVSQRIVTFRITQNFAHPVA